MSKIDSFKLRLICNALRHQIPVNIVADTFDISVYKVRSFVNNVVRILVDADYHTGHVVGLTPPDFQLKVVEGIDGMSFHNKWATTEQEIWSWREPIIESLKPIDVHMFLGDAIDGDGTRSGGTEELCTDRTHQVNMALECFKVVEAGATHMVFGTPYHNGTAEDFELLIAEKLSAKIGNHDWYEYNGCVFDLKHFQTNPLNPYTSLLNEIKANREWADLGEQPYANVLIRAHTHRWAMCQGEGYVAISCPAMQGYGSKYGAKMMKNKVSIGFLVIDVWPDGYPQVTPFIAKLSNQLSRVDNVI